MSVSQTFTSIRRMTDSPCQLIQKICSHRHGASYEPLDAVPFARTERHVQSSASTYANPPIIYMNHLHECVDHQIHRFQRIHLTPVKILCVDVIVHAHKQLNYVSDQFWNGMDRRWMLRWPR